MHVTLAFAAANDSLSKQTEVGMRSVLLISRELEKKNKDRSPALVTCFEWAMVDRRWTSNGDRHQWNDGEWWTNGSLEDDSVECEVVDW